MSAKEELRKVARSQPIPTQSASQRRWLSICEQPEVFGAFLVYAREKAKAYWRKGAGAKRNATRNKKRAEDAEYRARTIEWSRAAKERARAMNRPKWRPTPEQRERYREKNREYQRRRSASMTAQEREEQKARVRERYQKRAQDGPRCVTKGCANAHVARGLCSACYTRERRAKLRARSAKPHDGLA